ncbi:unnamed protein product, partial [Hapterophycus canaliculatus]
KREFVTPPLPPLPEPILGPNGWVRPPPPPPPVNRIIGRTTALRLKSGEFVQHKMGLMKRTQAYARRSNVPVDNLVTFSIINPHTQRRYNVTREFCAAPCYATIYKRLLRDTVRKNLSLVPILSRQAPSARAAAAAAAATAAAAAAAALPTAGDPLRAGDGGSGGGVVVAAAPSDSGRLRDEDSGRSSKAPSALPPLAAAERKTINGLSGRGSAPPTRNHQLPRGPGGIDILSGPAPHVRTVSGADAAAVEAVAAGVGGEGANDAVVAAAAMLGLGAEVFAGKVAGRDSAAKAEAKRGAASGAAAGAGGEVAGVAVSDDPGLSNGHGPPPGRGGTPDAAPAKDRQQALSIPPEGSGGGTGGASRRLADVADEEEAAVGGGGGDGEDARRIGRPPDKSALVGGTVTDGVVKDEGMDVEQPLAKGEQEQEQGQEEEEEEGRATEEALTDFDPCDVFKGV